MATPTVPHISIYSPLHQTSPTLNLDAISKDIRLPTTPTHHQGLKQYKNCHSHKQLQLSTLKINLTSPKAYPQEPQTERNHHTHHKIKNFDAINVSPFEVAPHTARPDYAKLNVLTPVNRNLLNIEEPKRPKILRKQRASHSFSEEFKLGKVLGKGRFGNVYKAQHLSTGFVCAVKQISLAQMSAKLAERLTWEMKIQSFLRHEHCLELYKYYREGSSLFLVVELGECSLFDKLREKRYFTEVETCYYVTQTVKALMHLHEHGVIHRDLKPENIVLVNNIVKLADFGWAIHINKAYPSPHVAKRGRLSAAPSTTFLLRSSRARSTTKWWTSGVWECSATSFALVTLPSSPARAEKTLIGRSSGWT